MQATEDPIGHLDFEPEFSCEHDQHQQHGQEPATFYIRAQCPHCKAEGSYFLCRAGWRSMESAEVPCESCQKTAPRNDSMKIVDIVKEY